jgi:hypothetical protein
MWRDSLDITPLRYSVPQYIVRPTSSHQHINNTSVFAHEEAAMHILYRAGSSRHGYGRKLYVLVGCHGRLQKAQQQRAALFCEVA